MTRNNERRVLKNEIQRSNAALLEWERIFLEKDYDIDYLRVRRMRLKQKFKNKKK